MSEQKKQTKSPPEPVLPRKKPFSYPQNAALKERTWADRTEEPTPEPTEETYRDGSMKNECW